jgi:hypothetical protein
MQRPPLLAQSTGQAQSVPWPHEAVVILCQCGRIRPFRPRRDAANASGAADMLIYDLQFRLRCEHCSAWRGFRIVIEDTRPVADRSLVGDPDVVIVEPN